MKEKKSVAIDKVFLERVAQSGLSLSGFIDNLFREHFNQEDKKSDNLSKEDRTKGQKRGPGQEDYLKQPTYDKQVYAKKHMLDYLRNQCLEWIEKQVSKSQILFEIQDFFERNYIEDIDPREFYREVLELYINKGE